jgi:hypothetical protein
VPPRFEALCPGYRREAADAGAQQAELVAMSVAVRRDLARRSLGRFVHHDVCLETFSKDPRAGLQSLSRFLGLEPHADQLQFLEQREAVTRGGRYSSFRAASDVQGAWRRHLSDAQRAAVEAVLQAVDASARDEVRAAGRAA